MLDSKPQIHANISLCLLDVSVIYLQFVVPLPGSQKKLVMQVYVLERNLGCIRLLKDETMLMFSVI